MIYLDTHVVVWLYSGLTDKLTDIAKSLINDNEVYISAIVRLELQYLYEIKRIKDEPDMIISDPTGHDGAIFPTNVLSLRFYRQVAFWRNYALSSVLLPLLLTDFHHSPRGLESATTR